MTPENVDRHQARSMLKAIFQKTAAYAAKHRITESEIDAALCEAMQHNRPGPEGKER
jgi:hypothetical protein